ncbi:MAG: hypothetical protein K2X87_02035 [Gemmataceae bacterium]|nr:hypothetical protein [Gemmataceae bacterium]
MINVPLGNRLFAFVDTADGLRVLTHGFWRLHGRSKTNIGVVRGFQRGKAVTLGKFVMGIDVDDPRHVITRSRIPLVCTRGNLEVVSLAFYRAFQTLSVVNQTGYRGVGVVGDRFSAYIHVDGRRRSLKTYRTAIEAARAYDAAVAREYGPGAVELMNFPNSPPQGTDMATNSGAASPGAAPGLPTHIPTTPYPTRSFQGV